MSAITLLAFALRLISINNGDLSFDEAASALIARKSLGEMIPYLLGAIHEHPPGYYVLLSSWIRVAGDGEAMLRFLSVVMGTLSIPLMYRWAKETIGPVAGIVAALVLSVAPVHVWYSQNARMYTLIGVLALLSWWLIARLERTDRVKYWIGLSASGLIGLLTHYYMGMVILSQGAYLLLTAKRNRRLLLKWLLWLGVPIALGGIYLAASPGALATVLASFGRGLGSSVSVKALRALAADMVFGPHGNLGIEAWSAILLIALGGIGLALSGRVGVKRSIGAMLICALLVPLALILLLPEALAARYVLFLIFPLVLALTIVVVSPLGWHSRAARPLTVAAALAFVALNVSRLPYHYDALKGDYGRVMAKFHAGYQPGDVVIFNGPWQAVLQTYYPIGDVPSMYLPPATPPSLDPAATEPQLVELLAKYRRIWVIPLAVNEADPDRFVARWLDQHAHHAIEEPDIALYYAPAKTGLPLLSAPTRFGAGLALESAQLAADTVSTGEAACVTLEWRTVQPIDGDVMIGLDVVAPDGNVWGRRLYRPGERFVDAAAWNSGTVVVDRQAVPIDPGAPPGEYSLRVTAQRASTGEILTPAGRPNEVSITLGSLRVESARDLPDARARGTPIGARFGNGLALISSWMPSHQFVQGGVIPIVLYWRALAGDRGVSLDVALANEAGEPIEVWRGSLGPAWYAAPDWRPGELIAVPITLRVPPRLPPGAYRLQAGVRDATGQSIAARGWVEQPGFLSLWTDRVEAERAAWLLGHITVAARDRSFTAPSVQHPLSIAFGDRIALIGYNLDATDLRAGGSLRVTFYWQALTPMDQDFTVFTHLRDASGELRGQRDSMPVNGANPTSFWEKGEVVADTYAVGIDPNAPAGRYTLHFGWYDGDTGDRLAAIGAGAQRYRDDVAVIDNLNLSD